MITVELAETPSFCAHEHWGSIDSIGMTPEGFRADVVPGATPLRRTGLMDILLDPYFGGSLGMAGVNVNSLASDSGFANFREMALSEPVRAMSALRPALKVQRMTGTYQCIRRGVMRLYGIDIDVEGDDGIAELDSRIGNKYSAPFAWYREAMIEARMNGLIRPVHPEFYFADTSSAEASSELGFTNTVMRIDPLLGMWPTDCPRREKLAARLGVEPRDAASWRRLLEKLFDKAAKSGSLGIKQLQAYSRSLDFRARTDAQVAWKGPSDPDQVRAFQDWIVHECCRLAHDRGWPHQIHVGTHNLSHSSPLPLSTLAEKYPNMKIVQLHCWPFLREAGWLARQHRNVFIDTCWLPVLNPRYYRNAVEEWINYVPLHKIMCAHDSTSVEMAAGSLVFVREILAEILSTQSTATGMGERLLEQTAAMFLNGNANEVYLVH
ncbi:MAG TPA: amidohydrolase family protein [Candidatus Brocadiia bacterium]|nr:amidohydrolase family protein [Candidatus Brocadiia bacterium]